MRFRCQTVCYHLLQPGLDHNFGNRVLATRLVGSLPVRVKLLLYSVDQLLNPHGTVVDDVNRIIPNIGWKLQRNSWKSGLRCMRRNELSTWLHLFRKSPVLFFLLGCLSESKTILACD